AEHVARRRGRSPEDPTPQTRAWMALGVALAAYDQWLRRPEADLEELLRSGCELLIAAADAPAERVEPGP
ncbi:mycofactocin system transcriptional regulator, partial [Tsukamurella tyrosinosolvens]